MVKRNTSTAMKSESEHEKPQLNINDSFTNAYTELTSTMNMFKENSDVFKNLIL